MIKDQINKFKSLILKKANEKGEENSLRKAKQKKNRKFSSIFNHSNNNINCNKLHSE